MQKTIVALSGLANAGKTTTIRLVYEELLREKGTIVLQARRRIEITAILEINGVKIGFASQGDAPDVLKENLKRLVEAGCSVIICAMHTIRSRTQSIVKRLEPDYEIVWIEKRGVALADIDRANQEKADEIIRQVRVAIE